MGKRLRAFWNDAEGLTQKDWILLLSSLVFFGFIAVGLIMLLIGNPIDPMYIELLKMISPVLMSIVAGVFGLNIAHEIRKPKEDEIIETDLSDNPRVNQKQEYYDDRI